MRRTTAGIERQYVHLNVPNLPAVFQNAGFTAVRSLRSPSSELRLRLPGGRCRREGSAWRASEVHFLAHAAPPLTLRG